MLTKLVVVAAFAVALFNPLSALAKNGSDLIANADQVKQAQLAIEKICPELLKWLIWICVVSL